MPSRIMEWAAVFGGKRIAGKGMKQTRIQAVTPESRCVRHAVTSRPCCVRPRITPYTICSWYLVWYTVRVIGVALALFALALTTAWRGPRPAAFAAEAPVPAAKPKAFCGVA
jgi:hypothetical protein